LRLNPNVWFGNVERVAFGTDWPRDGHLRQQHLQVLRHLPSDERSAGSTPSSEGECWEAQVTRA
jgi:hypothetical protein